MLALARAGEETDWRNRAIFHTGLRNSLVH
jgi:hypothetical protein